MNDRFVAEVPRAPGLVPATARSELNTLDAEDLRPDRSIFHIPNLVRLLYRWRWLVLACIAGCLLVAGAAALLQTPLYRATATLELNPAPARVVQIAESDESRQSDREFLALQVGLIRSRNVAEKVARSLNLGRDERFLGFPAGDGRAENAIGPLMSGFSAQGTASDRIMQISFVHPDPAIAARVANGYAEAAVETNYERGFEATARSRTFLQRRLETTRQELERAERQLIDYARRANIVNIVAGEQTPTSGDTAGGTLLASRLVSLNTQLAEAQNARIVAQQRYAQSTASANSATVTDPTVQSLQQQRATLQAEYDQKLERFQPSYPDMVQLRARIEGLDRQIAQASRRTSSSVAGSLRAEMVAAQNRENQLRARVAELQGQLMDLGERGVQYNILRRAVDANRSLYNALLERLGQENSSATRTSGIAIIDTADVPGAPVSPNVPRSLMLGLIAGIILGITAAVAADNWYDTIDLPEDIRDLLGLPLLGVIPLVTAREDVDEALTNPRSSLAEAYHSVRASLQFLNDGRPPRSIFLTSARAGEGKTSSTIAIAADFTSVGMRVLVIDADLRRPSLRGRGNASGLAEILAGNRLFDDEMLKTETPGLYLLEAGSPPPDPTVLLSSSVFADLLRRLERQFDVIIVDGPPVLGLADGPLIASVTQATVVVIQSGAIRKNVAANAIRRLREGGGQVVGAVLTKFDQKHHGYGYGYGYYYDYQGSDSKKRRLIGYQGAAPSADA
jgi:succinoglycan biosynthesis transport protein ExoP